MHTPNALPVPRVISDAVLVTIRAARDPALCAARPSLVRLAALVLGTLAGTPQAQLAAAPRNRLS